MAIGDLVVRLAADVAQFQSDMGKAAHIAQQQANAIQRSLAGVRNVLGAVGVAVGIAEAIASYKRVIDAAEEAKKAAERFGTSVESFSSLAYAGKTAGVEVEALEAAMTKLSGKMADAAGGGKQSAAVFEAMGIKVQNANGSLKATDELLREVADKFAGYKDGAAKAALATELFGKGGAAMIPMLNHLRAAEEEAKRLGVIFGTDLAKASAEFNDNLGRLNATMTASKIVMLNDVLPWLNKMLEQMQAGIGIAGGFANAIRLFGLSTITSDNAGSKIREIGDSIQELEAKRARFIEQGRKGFEGVIDPQIADLKKKLEFAKFMQRQVALGTAGPSYRDEGARFAKPLENAPIVPKIDAGELGKARQKVLDEAAKQELDSLKDLAKQRDSILEAVHQGNLISEKEFYSLKLDIAKSAIDAEVKVFGDQEARQRDVLSKQKSGTKEYYEAQGNLQETLAKRNKLEQEFGATVALTYLAAERAAKAYAKEVEDLNIQFLELQGNSVEAASRRFASSTQDQRKKFSVNGDTAALATLDTVGRLTVAQAEFNQGREEQDRIVARLQLSEDRLQNSLRVGAISEIDGLKQTGDARTAAATQLEAIVTNLERVARASNNPALILQAEQARGALEKLRSEADLLAEKFNTVFKDNLASALDSLSDKTKTTTEKIKGFFDGLARDITKIVNQSIATDLSKLFGISGGSGGGGGIGGLLATLFGGKSGAGGLSAIGAATGIGASDFLGSSGIMGPYDVGTDFVPRTGLAMVHRGEEIIPAGERSGVTVHMTVVTPDTGGFRQSEGQITARLAAAMRSSKRYT